MRGDDIKPVKLINGILDVAHDASSDIFFKSPKLVEEFRDMVKDPSKLKLFDDNMAERIFEYGRRTDQLDDVAKLAYSERTNKMIKLFDKFAKACK